MLTPGWEWGYLDLLWGGDGGAKEEFERCEASSAGDLGDGGTIGQNLGHCGQV